MDFLVILLIIVLYCSTTGGFPHNTKSISFPIDAIRCPFVGDWKYYYRKKGMQTSSDDVLVACVACKPWIVFADEEEPLSPPLIEKYADLGCGIGSTLLIVAYNTHPLLAIGVEAQEISYQMAARAIEELAPDRNHRGDLKVIQGDLRHVPLEHRSFDLITANPPFTPDGSGTYCKDEQRKFARFELRGGVEQYCERASSLLAHNGRFVLAFWHKDIPRVENAADKSGLTITRRLDVIAGAPSNTLPHLSIFEMRAGRREEASLPQVVQVLDITRDAVSGGISGRYKFIQKNLHLQPRPLK